MTRLTRRALLGGLAAGAVAAPALAFPDRTLRIISGFAPGGLNDIVSRAMAQALTPVLGQSVVVENRAGAGGGVGAAAAARAPADGHTLWMGIVDTQSIIPVAYRTQLYDPDKDFAPISLVAHFPFAVVVGPSQPGIRDFEGLIAAAKAQPGKLTFASWGVASTSHLAHERILRARGVEMLHVPFTSQAPAMQAIMAGQIDCMSLPAGGAESMTRDGRYPRGRGDRAAPARHHPRRADGEGSRRAAGHPGCGRRSTRRPARRPRSIARLNAAVREAMTAPSFIEVVRQQGAVPQPSTPEQLAALQASERQAWGDVVRATGAYVG